MKKNFMSYLVPSLIASVLMSMYAVVDGIFIGQKIGDAGLAAINISWPITALLQAIGTAFGLAGGIYSQELRAKNLDCEAKGVKTTALLLTSFVAILLGSLLYFIKKPLIQLLGATDASLDYALGYTKIILIGSLFQMLGMALIPLLKNSNRVKLAMVASLSSVFTNLLLDYLFIFVFDYGLVGAAWGSVIAQIISFLICLAVYLKDNRILLFKWKNVCSILKISIAPFILSYSYSIVIIITNLVCSTYGKDEAVAAYTLLSYLAYINIAIACAIGDSIQPLFSYNQGIKDYQANQKMLIKCLLISFLCCFILASLMMIFKKSLGNLYNLSDIAYDYYEKGMVYYAVGAIFIAFIKVISSYLYSIEEKISANIIITIEPFLLTPLFLWLFCSILGLDGVFVSYLVVQITLLVVASGLVIYSQKKFQKAFS